MLARDSAITHYSEVFGFSIDNIENLTLYKTVENWLLTPYCYAGRGKDGIDCSDFTAVLYDSAYGIKLQGGADFIFKKNIPLEKEDLREGDMVFFKIKNNTISHVGVYLTKNKFAHATVKAGVIISDLDEPYYRKYFYKGGRLKEEPEK